MVIKGQFSTTIVLSSRLAQKWEAIKQIIIVFRLCYVSTFNTY